MYLESAQHLVKTNRVIIDTEDHEYIIYTQNDQKVYNELINKLYKKSFMVRAS